MAAAQLTAGLIDAFIKSFDTVLVDCDGVLWAGSKSIERAAETLNYLKRIGKRVFYVTNNSTKTRNQYLSKLTGLGYNAEEEEIATSGFLVASYLQFIKFDRNVYLIGSWGLAEELRNRGINCNDPGPDQMEVPIQTYTSGKIEFEENIGAVVVGFDEHISYPKMLKAANYLSHPDCLFLATNSDETFPVDGPLVVPGTGTMVTAVATCSQRQPQVFGKPFRPMFEAISQRAAIEPQRTLMIGDRCNTDIAFGNNCGLQTLLVLTGVTTLKKLHQEEAEQRTQFIPNYYTNTISDILTLLEEASANV